MRKLLPFVLLFAGGCLNHTDEEKYEMIGKIVDEMGMIDDSLSYLHHNISGYLAGNTEHLQLKDKDTLYSSIFLDSLKKTPDSGYAKMMLRYNVLQERYNTYADIYSRIYRQLPADSAAKNEAIQRSFEQVQRKK